MVFGCIINDHLMSNRVCSIEFILENNLDFRKTSVTEEIFIGSRRNSKFVLLHCIVTFCKTYQFSYLLCVNGKQLWNMVFPYADQFTHWGHWQLALPSMLYNIYAFNLICWQLPHFGWAKCILRNCRFYAINLWRHSVLGLSVREGECVVVY